MIRHFCCGKREKYVIDATVYGCGSGRADAPRDTNKGLGEASADETPETPDAAAVVDAASSWCSDCNFANVKNNLVPEIIADGVAGILVSSAI